MAEGVEIRGNKSLPDLGREALSFAFHTFLAVLALVVVVGAFALFHAPQDSSAAKLLCTGLAFLVPMLFGFLLIKVRPNAVAPYVWISGMIMFTLVCVWVLDLPTGNGLCNGCGAFDKLWRTFFSIDHNSGLMAGDGLLIGTWTPLAMIGYAVGAKFAFTEEEAI